MAAISVVKADVDREVANAKEDLVVNFEFEVMESNKLIRYPMISLFFYFSERTRTGTGIIPSLHYSLGSS
jgi:hypothetical protein